MSEYQSQHLPPTTSSINRMILFVLLMAPAVVLLVGIVPAVLLIYGFVMALWRTDFSQITLAVRNCNYLLIGVSLLSGLIILGVSAFLGYEYYAADNDSATLREFLSTYDRINFVPTIAICGLIIFVTLAYKEIISRLFLAPLAEHREWLMGLKMPKMAIFEKKAKKIGDRGFRVVIDKPLPSAEVIDDIARWEKLKDEGRITHEEFDEIRIKILQRI